MKFDKPGKSKPNKKPAGDQTELLMRIIDVQSRVIDSLAMALGAITTVDEDKEGDEDEDEQEDKEEE